VNDILLEPGCIIDYHRWDMSKAAALVRRFQLRLNALDLSAIDRYVSSNFISYTEDIPSNKALWKELLKEEFRAFQEISCTIDSIYEDGDRVFLQLTEEYRQVAPLLGRRVDRRKIRRTLVNSFRVVNNRITDIFPPTVLQYAEMR
jgi:hypothetical protein